MNTVRNIRFGRTRTELFNKSVALAEELRKAKAELRYLKPRQQLLPFDPMNTAEFPFGQDANAVEKAFAEHQKKIIDSDVLDAYHNGSQVFMDGTRSIVPAVKKYRELTNVSLAEAVDYVRELVGLPKR